ncbi:TonB-dependent receptor [Hymenobacter cellulosivorans]|uniref:TonB-dependent receptor n=2 Tax=Hymenobacter cellulosivorans TaxID=2932249 RepID=A0ABY4F6I2_9BACT|nr:carboxypeptidase-like regulatory domain-containing protein [Hymenobacter cellulosivorans]UOQ52069.1 TonB-dependent receptor [Hymenobacter cellulosivorans]
MGTSGVALGQQQPAPLFSGDFNKSRFPELVKQLEAQTPYRLYYQPDALDTLTVTLRAQNQPLDSVLRTVLAKTPFRFAIDQQQRVFITTGSAIQPNLPNPFFLSGATEAVVVADEPTPESKPTTGGSELRLYEIGRNTAGTAPGRVTLAGHVRDKTSGEPVIGAAVFVEAPTTTGTTTDQFGYYALTLPAGRYEVRVRGIGIKNTKRQVQLNADGKLEIEVEEDITPLKEVVIEAEKDRNVAGMQMGVEKLDIKTMRQVPTAFGETDILRVVLTLPGVKSVGEGSTGMNVRGGATDQNLILFNDATIYNPAHLFGFFSAFNPDVLKSVELYKSAVPAKYGGRLSSVLEITTRDGNKKKFTGSGGIGLMTSRLALEGPLIKDRSSFLVAGRTSYSDWILHQIPNKTYQESSAAFYDLNAHISHQINDKNTIYATGYLSRDQFKLASDTLYKYLNQTASLKWQHNFNNRLYGVLTGSFSKYQYSITNQKNPVNAAELAFGINQSNLQADFSYFHNNKHTIDFGLNNIFYSVAAGSLVPLGSESLIKRNVLPREQALEHALYVSDKIDVTPRFAVSLGLRYSLFNALGPRDTYRYLPGLSKSENTITDTVSHKAGSSIATYHGPEYRISAKYSLSDNSSVKASYNRMRQYIHMLSNTASMSPTDIWKLSDEHIRPQVGDQYSIGYYRNFKNNTIETSVETYYKAMHDFVDYKSGATLLLNNHIETDVVNAKGKAYGVEVMVKKLTGKLNGWVSYTYSRSLVQVDTGPNGDVINGGKFYPSNFDKPHDVTLIGNYRFSRRFSTSLNFNYSTGRPITLPLAKFYAGNSMRVYYSERNAFRVPDYYRADFALNIEGNHKIKKLAHSSWTISVYNLTGRKNPYSVYYKAENGQINGYQLSIFGRPIPTITYNFKF